MKVLILTKAGQQKYKSLMGAQSDYKCELRSPEPDEERLAWLESRKWIDGTVTLPIGKIDDGSFNGIKMFSDYQETRKHLEMNGVEFETHESGKDEKLGQWVWKS